MDIDLPWLSRIRGTAVSELSPFEAITHLVRTHNRGRRVGKVKVAGRVASPFQSQTHDQVVFDVEADGTTLQVLVPHEESLGLALGQRVLLEGRLRMEATGSTLHPLLKGRIVQQGPQRRDLALHRTLPRLSLMEFLQTYESGLVILGTERAIHDVDDALKYRNLYPGPVRREIVRMASRFEVLAAVRRYTGIARAILFVRRGGTDSEFLFWSDPGFMDDLLASQLHLYLGLGHPENRTAFDQHADEVFSTPVAAGMALAQALLAPRETPVSIHGSTVRTVHESAVMPEPTHESVVMSASIQESAVKPMPMHESAVMSVPTHEAVMPELKHESAIEPAPRDESTVKSASNRESAVMPELTHGSIPAPARPLAADVSASPVLVQKEFYLSNSMIWAIALLLGAIVLIVGLR